MIFNVFFAVCAIFFQVRYHFSASLRRIYRVALEISGEKLYISQLPGFQYKKKIILLAPAMQEISHMQITQIKSEK